MSDGPGKTKDKPRAHPGHSLARTLAAIFGAPLAAGMLGVALWSWLPLDSASALLIGFHVIIPAWIALSCVLPLARSGARAWVYCGLSMVPALVTLVFP